MHNNSEPIIHNEVNDGWTLFYSDEGYPYYYNSHTGESVWADSDNIIENSQNYGEYVENESAHKDVIFDVTKVEDGDDYSSDSSTSNSTESEVTDDAFQEYLKTPEGSKAFKVNH